MTAWVLLGLVSIGLFQFHPDHSEREFNMVLALMGLTALGTIIALVVLRITDSLSKRNGSSRKIALWAYFCAIVALVPVAYTSLIIPWIVLVIVTLVYVRWKWGWADSRFGGGN
jgi:hypothetical protein